MQVNISQGGNMAPNSDSPSAQNMIPKTQSAPPVDPFSEESVAILTDELNNLTVVERDKILHDIHGVSDDPSENTVFVQQCFRDLEEALSLIPDVDKVAYLHAREIDLSFVTNDDFLLMFLRATSFDIHDTADRIVAFFETKLELFGLKKLAREITYDDLNEDDRRCLESGYAQVLGGRDRAGRTILCLMPMIRSHRTVENKGRAVFLLFMHCLRDVETQRKGLVGIAYNVGRGRTKDRDAVWKLAQVVNSLPTNFKAMHYCFDDEKTKLLFNVALFVFARGTRIRTRMHFGTDMECIYELMTFGIPGDVLPVTPGGELKLEVHQDFCRRLRNFESTHDNVERIVIPGTYDVLLGRGKPLQKHPGNLRYHHIIESYQDKYEKAQKLEKTQMSKEIVHRVKAEKGRFLKQDDAGWVEIDDDTARYKVSHTFRNHRIAARVQEKKKMEDHRRKLIEDPPTSDSDSHQTDGCDIAFDPKRRRVSNTSSVTPSITSSGFGMGR